MKIDKCGRNVASHNNYDRLKRLKGEKALRDCNKVPQSLLSVQPGKTGRGVSSMRTVRAPKACSDRVAQKTLQPIPLRGNSAATWSNL